MHAEVFGECIQMLVIYLNVCQKLNKLVNRGERQTDMCIIKQV